MLRVLLKNIIRGALKQYKVTLINLSGLILAFTALLFILNYVLYEKSFDTCFKNSDNIYRVTNYESRNGEKVYDGAKTPRGLFFSRDEIPGIEALSQAYFESCQVKYVNDELFEQRVLWVEEDFEKIFNLDMSIGKADFSGPLMGVISASKAKALFGKENPIGKIVKVNEGMPINITGVFEDLPSNTHLEADYFVSAQTWVYYGWIQADGSRWRGNGWWTYIRTAKEADTKRIEHALGELIKKHIPNAASEERNIKYSLQPLQSIHFDMSKDGDLGKKTSRTTVLMITLFGLFIMFVALINYINLSIASALKRETTFGIQSLIGAKPIHRISQVVLDNFLMNVMSSTVAWLLFFLLQYPFALVFDIPVDLAYIPGNKMFLGFILVFLPGLFISSLLTLLPVLKINPFI
ncbi:ABC transporter permease [Bacteroidales bacterium]|nr:ABC transporter permease [Bacteroidales bacterium]